MTAAPATPRLAILAGWLACACILGVPLGFFAGGLAGEPAKARVTPSESATLGVFPVAIGAILAVLTLAPRGRRDPSRLAKSVVRAALSHFGVAAVLGVVVAANADIQAVPFVTALGTSALLCLVVEFAWAARALRVVQHAQQATPT